MFFDHLPEQSFICGHRGARSIAPENTFLSMKKARDYGAHCWETDIRMSKDGELLVFHDATLDRTTNIATHKKFYDRADHHLDQFTLAELRELDAGSWFLKDDPFATIANGEVKKSEYSIIQGQQIPLLFEILNLTRELSFPVNLEIKDLASPNDGIAIVDQLIKLLEETETMDLVLLSSFNHDYLHHARALSDNVAIAVLATKNHPANLLQYLKSFSAAAYHPEKGLYTSDLVKQLKTAGIRVNSWTVNESEKVEEMLRAGAGIVTDWPQQYSLATT